MEERTGIAHLFDGGVTLQGGETLVVIEEFAGIADTRRSERLNRAGGNAVDADTVRSHGVGQIAHVGLQTGHGQSHDVVVGNGAYRAEGVENANAVKRERALRSRNAPKTYVTKGFVGALWCRRGGPIALLG